MSHPGKVAGLFVGVALIIGLIAAAGVWLCLRRKRNAEAETIASTTGGETPQRRQSKMSTMGLLGGTRRSNNRKSVPMIQTSGWGPGNSTEKSPSDTPIDYRRTSYPRVVDQRLEPAALWNPLQDNGSHVSIQSFRDDQDYSRRMLRVSYSCSLDEHDGLPLGRWLTRGCCRLRIQTIAHTVGHRIAQGRCYFAVAAFQQHGGKSDRVGLQHFSSVGHFSLIFAEGLDVYGVLLMAKSC